MTKKWWTRMHDSEKLTWLHSVWLSSAAATVTRFFVKAHSLALASFYAELSAVPNNYIQDWWSLIVP
jgi:hypothetical protein